MEISLFIAPLIVAILGIAIRSGKASFLIAGYNTSSKEEKDKYDEKALCKFIGNLLLVLAGIFLLVAVAKVLNLSHFIQIMIAAYTLCPVVTIAAVIYLNTGNRFKK